MSATINEYAKDLLVLDYEYLTEQLIANEEMGEKRVGLFVSLTAGLGAAAVLVLEKFGDGGATSHHELFFVVNVAWLLFGYLTFSRIIHRNVTTDDIKRQLDCIRGWFVAESDSPTLRDHLPYDPDKPFVHRTGLKFFRGKGGYAELVALINAVLTGAVGWQAFHYLVGLPLVPKGDDAFVKALAIEVASIAAIVVWQWQSREAAKHYKPKEQAAGI
jgi:hypothetical protein